MLQLILNCDFCDIYDEHDFHFIVEQSSLFVACAMFDDANEKSPISLFFKGLVGF
jgi:hypothetical protein